MPRAVGSADDDIRLRRLLLPTGHVARGLDGLDIEIHRFAAPWRIARRDIAAVVDVRRRAGRLDPNVALVLAEEPAVALLAPSHQHAWPKLVVVFRRPLALPPLRPGFRRAWMTAVGGGRLQPGDAVHGVALDVPRAGRAIERFESWGYELGDDLASALADTIGVTSDAAVITERVDRRARRRALAGVAVAATTLLTVAVVVGLRSWGRSSDSPCPASAPAPSVYAPPDEAGVLVQAGPISLQDAAGGVYGTEARLARLAELGATSAFAQQWQQGAVLVDVRTIEFRDGAGALAYAATDAEVICRFASSTFEPEGIDGGLGVVQDWQEGPDGYWVGSVSGSTYVRAYARFEEGDAGREAVARGVRRSVAR